MLIVNKGILEYSQAFSEMMEFVDARVAQQTQDQIIEDQIWLVEHPPVFTLGLSEKNNTQKTIANYPVVKSNRGGQITFHTYGQLIFYLLIDIKNYNLKIRNLVELLEDSVIELLANYSVLGEKLVNPGVYVEGKKIASLGLKLKKSFVYHGLSFNLNADLSPSLQIDPCGITDMKMCNFFDFIKLNKSESEIKQLINYELANILKSKLLEKQIT